MRRTQLYLDDHLWSALHAHAQAEKTTVSALVRQAIRERYPGDRNQRAAAMQRFIGSGKSRVSRPDAMDEIRRLRRRSRLDQLNAR